jgi:hypothetical protein
LIKRNLKILSLKHVYCEEKAKILFANNYVIIIIIRMNYMQLLIFSAPIKMAHGLA